MVLVIGAKVLVLPVITRRRKGKKSHFSNRTCKLTDRPSGRYDHRGASRNVSSSWMSVVEFVRWLSWQSLKIFKSKPVLRWYLFDFCYLLMHAYSTAEKETVQDGDVLWQHAGLACIHCNPFYSKANSIRKSLSAFFKRLLDNKEGERRLINVIGGE